MTSRKWAASLTVELDTRLHPLRLTLETLISQLLLHHTKTCRHSHITPNKLTRSIPSLGCTPVQDYQQVPWTDRDRAIIVIKVPRWYLCPTRVLLSLTGNHRHFNSLDNFHNTNYTPWATCQALNKVEMYSQSTIKPLKAAFRLRSTLY